MTNSGWAQQYRPLATPRLPLLATLLVLLVVLVVLVQLLMLVVLVLPLLLKQVLIALLPVPLVLAPK